MSRNFDARETRFGGYLEDYSVGDTYRHWPGKTITAAEDHLFCLLTMAANPLHVDEKYAAENSEFGRTVVVGTYIYALLLGMSMPDISGRAIANLGLSELRHVAPVFHGDTLYGSTTVLETRESRTRPSQGVITVKTTGVKQDDSVVCEFVRSVLLPRRMDDVARLDDATKGS